MSVSTQEIAELRKKADNARHTDNVMLVGPVKMLKLIDALTSLTALTGCAVEELPAWVEKVKKGQETMESTSNVDAFECNCGRCRLHDKAGHGYCDRCKCDTPRYRDQPPGTMTLIRCHDCGQVVARIWPDERASRTPPADAILEAGRK